MTLLSRCFTFVFLLFIYSTAIAQNNSLWSIGFVFSPDYSYRFIKGNDKSAKTQHEINEVHKSDKPLWFYRSGVIGKYFFNSKLAVETGVLFAKKGFKSGLETYIIDPQKGVIGGKIIMYEFYNEYYQIPMRIKYYIKSTGLKILLTTGISIDYSINSELYNEVTKQHSWNSEFLCGAGVTYSINNSLELNLQPEFRYAFTDTYTEDNNLSMNFYSLGTNISISWKF